MYTTVYFVDWTIKPATKKLYSQKWINFENLIFQSRKYTRVSSRLKYASSKMVMRYGMAICIYMGCKIKRYTIIFSSSHSINTYIYLLHTIYTLLLIELMLIGVRIWLVFMHFVSIYSALIFDTVLDCFCMPLACASNILVEHWIPRLQNNRQMLICQCIDP